MSELKPCKCKLCDSEFVPAGAIGEAWKHPRNGCNLSNVYFGNNELDKIRALMDDTPDLLRGARIGLEMAAGKLAEILQDRWNDWCADTGCFPGDFTMHRKTLSFRAGTWAEYCANDIRALKSTAPVRDDARDERLINFAINAEVSYQRRVAVHRTAKEILAAFNTQDKP